MHRDRPNDERELQRLAEGVVDSILEAPEDEIDDALRAAGEDPREVAERTRRLVRAAVDRRRKERLRRARERYESRAAVRREGEFEWPGTVEEGRRVLAELCARPAHEQTLTLQFRDLKGMPDEDVRSLLRQLAELGALDDYLK